MATTGRLDVEGTVPTIVSREILKYTMPNLEFWNRINTKITGGFNVGDTMHIPVYNDNNTPNTGVSVATQLPTGATNTYGIEAGGPGANAGGTPTAEVVAGVQTLTYTEQAMSVAATAKVFIANWYYVGMELTTYADAVSQADLTGLFRQAGLDSLAVQIDTSIATLVSALSTNAARGTLNVSTTDDIILDGMGDLDGQNIPGDDRSYVFSNLEKVNFLKLDKYVNSLYRGDTKPLTRGDIGNLYGIDWGWTTQVVASGGGHKNLMFHRNAFAGVMRRDPQAKVVDTPDPTLGQRIVSYAIWGANLLRGRFGVQISGL